MIFCYFCAKKFLLHAFLHKIGHILALFRRFFIVYFYVNLVGQWHSSSRPKLRNRWPLAKNKKRPLEQVFLFEN